MQFYTGQYLDIRTITAYAHSTSHGNSSADTNNVTEKSEDAGIIVGWDLAHAIGNVELCLHDWNVDFAIWCNYKYVNGGPGVIGGLFVHENHGRVDTPVEEANRGLGYRHRLSGWWGGNRSSRFRMENSTRLIQSSKSSALTAGGLPDLTPSHGDSVDLILGMR